MAFKELFGLGDGFSDMEIIEKIRQAQAQNKTTVVFTKEDGTHVEISLAPIEFFECGILD